MNDKKEELALALIPKTFGGARGGGKSKLMDEVVERCLDAGMDVAIMHYDGVELRGAANAKSINPTGGIQRGEVWVPPVTRTTPFKTLMGLPRVAVVTTREKELFAYGHAVHEAVARQMNHHEGIGQVRRMCLPTIIDVPAEKTDEL